MLSAIFMISLQLLTTALAQDTPSPTPTPNDMNLVSKECEPEYDALELQQTEPIQEDKVLTVMSANEVFNKQARDLQVPGYDPTVSRHRHHRRHKRSAAAHRGLGHVRHNLADMSFTYTYSNIDWTGPTVPSLPLDNEFRLQSTEIRFRVRKGITELLLCELETFYVRRYNKFPFYVKSVACRKNSGLTSYVQCRQRYEKGHILRLEKMSHCYQEKSSLKWIHAWETRVVGCDAVVPISPDNRS